MLLTSIVASIAGGPAGSYRAARFARPVVGAPGILQ